MLQDSVREQADSFYSYANETRLILLGLEDVPLVALLTQKIDEELLVESLGKLNLGDVAAVRVPLGPHRLEELEKRKLELGESLMEHGNEEIMQRIDDESGGCCPRSGSISVKWPLWPCRTRNWRMVSLCWKFRLKKFSSILCLMK